MQSLNQNIWKIPVKEFSFCEVLGSTPVIEQNSKLLSLLYPILGKALTNLLFLEKKTP